MSSFAVFVVRPLAAEGRRALSLCQVLPKGARCLSKTLNNLASPRARLEGEETALLGWTRLEANAEEAGERFELRLEGQRLPRSMTAEGIERLSIQLRVCGETAEVFQKVQGSVRTRASAVRVSQAVQEQATRLVNRSVNQVLAYALAGEIRKSVAQRVVQRVPVGRRQPVLQKITADFAIRTYARI
jgi:hypothetical protein